MNISDSIKTTKIIYPQIYAYTLPTMPDKNGWVKIGYTDRQNVDIRIREQTKTAAFEVPYNKLWNLPAKFSSQDKWFKDKEFHRYLKIFKNIQQKPNTEWFYYNGNPEKSLRDFYDFIGNSTPQSSESEEYTLRKEQAEAVAQTLCRFKKGADTEFLWNAKPRFGKTLTTYDLALKMQAKRVLIVTNRPSISNSWFDDFAKFIDWQSDYAFVSTTESLAGKPVMSREQFLAQQSTGKPNMIAFISLQDLKGAICFGGHIDKLTWVKELSWDLLVIDEAHEGVDTIKTEVAFNLIERSHTLHLSGTPFKALASGKFHSDDIFNWSYVDEQEAKLSWDGEGSNPYALMPKLNLLAYRMSDMITDTVNRGALIEGDTKEYAFNLNEFFETGDDGKLIHEKDVEKWLNTLTQNKKYPFSTNELREELKHTVWLLNRVDSAIALKAVLDKHPVFENYKVVLAVGDGRFSEDAQNLSVLEQVRLAIENHDKTITLTVGQLTTGITIPEWSAILMLSNIKSSSLYIQATFRTQNPWSYEKDGVVHQKENAYVFDFAPERTLMLYDEFASNQFSNGKLDSGTSDERKENIRKLLNFFPVIAEDAGGEMVELDAEQVLTIPRAIRSQEVVRRGFMCNLLFQNISRVFASAEAREILEKINPVDEGKTMPRISSSPVDTQGVELDEHGNAIVDNTIIISQTSAKFGEKIYGEIAESILADVSLNNANLTSQVSSKITSQFTETISEISNGQGLSKSIAKQVTTQASKLVEREVEIVVKNAQIKQREAEVEYEKALASSYTSAEIQAAETAFKDKKQQIEQEFQKDVTQTVLEKSRVAAEQATHTIFQKAEENKKTSVENDFRANLRGFSRTIPSFLMAYGTEELTLNDFDKTVPEHVFKELTGINLDEFRILRDEYQFFDEIVFNDSVREFMNKRKILSNYFDESQDEDIFDYIPPQKTNQIFTPKWVVKMMVDKMVEEDPDVFKDPNRTFADLYMKSGLYMAEVVKRLFEGLSDKIPDENERLQHILENQIYGFAPTEVIHRIARNFIFGFDSKASKFSNKHIVHLDTVPFSNGDGDFEKLCDEIFGAHQ